MYNYNAYFIIMHGYPCALYIASYGTVTELYVVKMVAIAVMQYHASNKCPIY